MQMPTKRISMLGLMTVFSPNQIDQSERGRKKSSCVSSRLFPSWFKFSQHIFHKHYFLIRSLVTFFIAANWRRKREKENWTLRFVHAQFSMFFCISCDRHNSPFSQFTKHKLFKRISERFGMQIQFEIIFVVPAYWIELNFVVLPVTVRKNSSEREQQQKSLTLHAENNWNALLDETKWKATIWYVTTFARLTCMNIEPNGKKIKLFIINVRSTRVK